MSLLQFAMGRPVLSLSKSIRSLSVSGKLHFEHPYDSPDVIVINDDARSYIQSSHDHFDLIVFVMLVAC
jgi:predicted membrane-bound spermidine synthase